MRAVTLTIEGEIEMFRKLTTVLPIAILLGAVSAAPALAQTPSHHLVQPHRQARVSPYAGGAFAFASSETANTMSCPTMEGYPDCHPGGRAPFTTYSGN
jgi:hypothetical protein